MDRRCKSERSAWSDSGIQETRGRIKRYRTVCQDNIAFGLTGIGVVRRVRELRTVRERIPLPATRRSLVKEDVYVVANTERVIDRYRCREVRCILWIVLVEVRDEVIARLWRQVRANDNLVGLLWRNNLGQWNLKTGKRTRDILILVSDVTLDLKTSGIYQHTFVVDIELTISAVELTILNTIESTLYDEETVALDCHVGIITATDHRTLGPNRMDTTKSNTLTRGLVINRTSNRASKYIFEASALAT